MANLTRRQLARPVDILWQPTTLLSIIIAGELLAFILAMSSAATEDFLVRFGLASFAIQWVSLFSLGILLLGSKWIGRLSAASLITLSVAAMFLITLASAAISRFVLIRVGLEMQASWYESGLRLFAAMLCMLLFGLIALRSHWAAQTQEYRAKQSELSALQARVDPHFLFNTLNTAIALVHARPDAAEQVLLDLSDLFRAALSETQTVPLAKELELTDRYLEIEQIRFGERLRVMRQYPESLPDISLPSLSIQPLVENAIRHGIEPLMRGGYVVIRVEAQRDKVVIEIENERGTPDASPARVGHRVGIAGVRARIQASTQGLGKVESESDDKRHLARIILPR